MKSIIDIHSHILPGVDNGCGSRDESLAMLKSYEKMGTEAVICTPHFGAFSVKGSNEADSFLWLQSVESSVKRYLGSQILLTRYSLDDLRRGISHTLAGSEWILIDFDSKSFSGEEEDILDAMRWVKNSKYVPILAQPERYHCMQEDHKICDEIDQIGVRFQINAGSLICDDATVRETAQYLLEKKLVMFVGSNAHNAEELNTFREGIQWIYDNCPEEYADAVVHDNAAKILC